MLKVWYDALTQDYLDLRLRTSSEVMARIVERPGLWISPRIGSGCSATCAPSRGEP